MRSPSMRGRCRAPLDRFTGEPSLPGRPGPRSSRAPASPGIFFPGAFLTPTPTTAKTAPWRRALSRLEVDSHIFATLLFRSWSVIGGGVTVLLIPVFLSSVQQGYYYTFASILALQVFFELGMGQVIVQIVAHEAADLHQGPDGRYHGSAERMGRMNALRHLLGRWYLLATALFLVCVNVMGWLFFRGHELPWTQWAAPWFLLVGATACNLVLSWRIAIVEGFGLVREVGRLRLFQSMAGFSLMWLVLVSGGGLWVVAIVPAMAAAFSWRWLRRRPAADVLAPMPMAGDAPPGTRYISWRTEILPFQWRIAVSWISGFFIFQLFAPLIFKYHGAAEAGRVGLGITIFNSVVTVGTSWVAAKVPTFGRLIAQGHKVEASAMFRRLTIASLIFAVSAACVLVVVVHELGVFQFRIANRLPAVPVLIFLALASVGNAFVLPAAMFMRAHKEEPLLASAVAMAIATGIAVTLAAPYGAMWVVGSYGVLVWLIGVPWTATILLRRYYRRPTSVPDDIP